MIEVLGLKKKISTQQGVATQNSLPILGEKWVAWKM